MRYILGIIILTGCSISTTTKEWSDSYDPAQWRDRYEICKNFINTELWIECMGDFS
jgi:hypothetical protein